MSKVLIKEFDDGIEVCRNGCSGRKFLKAIREYYTNKKDTQNIIPFNLEDNNLEDNHSYIIIKKKTGQAENEK